MNLPTSFCRFVSADHGHVNLCGLALLFLAFVLCGCSVVQEQNARIQALEQKLGDIEAKVQTVESANQELAKRIEQVSTDKSAERRILVLEEKQSNMEKMQMELVQYQDSLRNSIAKVKTSVDELKSKLEEVKRTGGSVQKQPGTSETSAEVRPEEKTPGVVEIEVKQTGKPKEKSKEKEEPRGFILDEF